MGDILGIHHMSAISGPAQENLDFYTGVLGLRLVKLTVDFDDPSAYHLYYGDGLGNPGTLLTFFPFPNGHPGRPGAGQATVTHLSVPYGSIGYWVDRFRENEVDFDRPNTRDNRDSIQFRAPDGLQLELVGCREFQKPAPWMGSPVPHSKAIGGIAAITIVQRELRPTQAVLEEILGFRFVGEKKGRFRFEVSEGGMGSAIDVIVDAEGLAARQGHGSIHHIAFRVPDDQAQEDRRLDIANRGFHVSPVMDRNYFRSIYFREPGGILLEIATDPPGFTVDEAPEMLGTALRLPKNLEEHRTKIERSLPPLRLP